MARQNTYGSKERLKSRKSIERLFREGRHITIPGFRVLYLIQPHVPGSFYLQAGVSVSSRNFKKAVDRNRIKRLMRESYRLQKTALEDALRETNTVLQLFFIYSAKELPAYKLVFDKMQVILKKLQDLVNENNTPHT